MMRLSARVSLHCVVVPLAFLVITHSGSFLRAQSPSQDAINEGVKEWRTSTDRRLGHLESMADAEFIALIGMLVSQIVMIRKADKGKA